jgi:hypothetical protein
MINQSITNEPSYFTDTNSIHIIILAGMKEPKDKVDNHIIHGHLSQSPFMQPGEST